MPGAALLCAVAAMRAGVGKLQVATCASAAPLVALAVPEARVIALPETRAGRLAASARAKLETLSEGADAIVVGPGLLDSAASARTLAGWLSRLDGIPVVVDAAAICAFEAPGSGVSRRPIARILTPHSGEAARLLGIERERIDADPRKAALALAERFNATVAMKGAVSWIVDGPGLNAGQKSAVHYNRHGNVGLATSGSGDTLAGSVGGLAARGAAPPQALAWGVYLHAAAGEVLAARMGTLGYLARELLDEVPAVMNGLSPARTGARDRPRTRKS